MEGLLAMVREVSEGNAAIRAKGKLQRRSRSDRSIVAKDPLEWHVCPGKLHQSSKIFWMSGEGTYTYSSLYDFHDLHAALPLQQLRRSSHSSL